MIQRSLVVIALAGLLMACGGGGAPAATSAPGGQTQAPVGATPAPGGGNTGDFESTARALLPAGSTQVSTSQVGNSFSIIASSNMSLEQLAAFYTQQIPALGLTESGRFEMAGTMTIALTNPDGGIVIVPGNDAGTYLVTVSLGTSS